jgi:7,8-dihydropterin-6-yl-methyl-4-(beta-D-ribofuranosyl)aminobenzene 5'-phosphate synthase
MDSSVRITVLVDNVAARPDMLVEHGLSMWIEYNDKRILWDTGQSDLLCTNAQTLGIDLAAANVIAISHGHYDHTGGLPAVMTIIHKADVYFHPAAVLPRYSKKQAVHPVGMPPSAIQSLYAWPVHLTESWMPIEQGIFLTGSIPRSNLVEDTGGAFYLDTECQVPDGIPDDQAMVLESEKGLIVVLGCAHSGVINTLDYIRLKTGKNRIYAVIGGMHLANADRQRLDRTVEAFIKYDVQKIIPLHCTGQAACDYLKDRLVNRVIESLAGPDLRL